MERVHAMIRSAPGAVLSRQGQALAWSLRSWAAALTRRYGAWGWCVAALSVAVCVAGWQFDVHARAARVLAQQHAARLMAIAQSDTLQALPVPQTDPQTNLRLFERALLPHDDIAQMIQDILQLAEDEGLSIERGNYRADPDGEGGFMRYRMQLPVRGKSAAIYRLIEKALLTHKHLTLDSLQFKRERVGSEVMEARIHWVALTQMPAERAR